MGPNECKWCGCEEVATKTDSEIVFRCWSSYVIEDDYWTVSNNCGARCAVQLVESRERVQQAVEDIEFMKAREANFVTALRSRLRTLNERIKRAVEVLETATRFDVIPWDGGVSRDPSDGGGEVDADVVDQVIEILRGEVPEPPDSSPVTADQLATEDYFEAVRQQVPWMTSIEHIEGLVEGYRQCGLMAWRAAEQIKLIFGGGNGQAD